MRPAEMKETAGQGGFQGASQGIKNSAEYTHNNSTSQDVTFTWDDGDDEQWAQYRDIRRWWFEQREKYRSEIETALTAGIPAKRLHNQARRLGLAHLGLQNVRKNNRESDVAEFGEDVWWWQGGEGFVWDDDLLWTVGSIGFDRWRDENGRQTTAPAKQLGHESNLFVTPSIVKIVERCSTLAHCLELGGNVPEPLWFASLTVTEHATPNASLEFSDGYPNFRAEELTEKIARIRQENRKPATCAHLRGLSFDTCKSCAWDVHSPMALGYDHAPKARKGGAR